ncbi:MAG: ankyrin repeat domain-containing protein [Balneolaceae bacterium]
MKSIVLLTLTTILISFTPPIDVSANEQNNEIIVAENIIEAIKEIDIVSLNVLLAEGAAVDTVDEEGNTPLMIAAKIGNPRMIEIVLAHNPELNVRNNQGDTALMIASAQGVLDVTKQLLDKGADVTMENTSGFNAVEIALRNGHRDVSRLIRGESNYFISR